MNATAIKAMMAELAPVIREYVASEQAPLIAENAALKAANEGLEKRLAAVEAREVPTIDGLVSAETVREMIEGALPNMGEELQPIIARMDAIAECSADRDERLATLEAREMPTAIKGDPGEVDMEQVRGILSDLVSAAFATIPAPQDGKSVDPDEVRQMVEEAVSAIPPAKDGESVDMDALRGIVDEMAQQAVSEQLPEAVKAIPIPSAPEPVAPDMEAIERKIREGIASVVREIPIPKDGENGIGLADALIDKDGNLVVTMTDGRAKALGVVVGKDGERGRDGETFTLDDFDIEQADERTLTFKFLRGDVMHSFELEFPVPIFREAYKEGREYRKGDMVVWGGSLWHANVDTKAKPDTEGSGWMIAARKGRDGKSAKPA